MVKYVLRAAALSCLLVCSVSSVQAQSEDKVSIEFTQEELRALDSVLADAEETGQEACTTACDYYWEDALGNRKQVPKDVRQPNGSITDYQRRNWRDAADPNVNGDMGNLACEGSCPDSESCGEHSYEREITNDEGERVKATLWECECL